MIFRAGLLVAGTLLVGLIAAGGVALFGAEGNTYLTLLVALVICLIPALATLLVGEIATQGKPELVGIVFLAGTLVRMGVVGFLAIGLHWQVDFFRRQEGWLAWVVFFYLVVLALETTLVVVGRKTPTT